MTERKKYSKEFKLDAVSLVIDQGYTRVEAARSLGINHSNKNGVRSRNAAFFRINYPVCHDP